MELLALALSPHKMLNTKVDIIDPIEAGRVPQTPVELFLAAEPTLAKLRERRWAWMRAGRQLDPTKSNPGCHPQYLSIHTVHKTAVLAHQSFQPSNTTTIPPKPTAKLTTIAMPVSPK